MSVIKNDAAASRIWLRFYYAMRGAFSVFWIAAAALLGKDNPGVAAGLLVAYTAWDAVANLVDARRSGGLARNPSQTERRDTILISFQGVAC